MRCSLEPGRPVAVAGAEWIREEGGNLPIHVYPANDLREHVTDSAFCPCLPRVLHEAGCPDRVVHNSYDGREVLKTCRDTIAMLGMVLTAKGLDLSPGQEDAFWHALNLLDMHLPA